MAIRKRTGRVSRMNQGAHDGHICVTFLGLVTSESLGTAVGHVAAAVCHSGSQTSYQRGRWYVHTTPSQIVLDIYRRNWKHRFAQGSQSSHWWRLCDSDRNPCNIWGFTAVTCRTPSSGMRRRVAFVRSDVSEERIVFIIRVTTVGYLGITVAVTSNRSTLRRSTFFAC
jgi:hypothetical protein